MDRSHNRKPAMGQPSFPPAPRPDTPVPGHDTSSPEEWRRSELSRADAALGLAALLGAVAAVSTTVIGALDYRATLAFDCGTGRLAAISTLCFAGFLLVLPVSVWIGAQRGTWLARVGRAAAFLPGLFWLIAQAFLFLGEGLR